MLPGFASLQEAQTMKARGEELVDGFEPSTHPAVFSSKNQV